MLKFEIIEDVKNETIKELYITAEKSFDCYPVVNVDINIAIAYLNLGIDSEDMCVKCIWGFSPRESWEEKSLNLPVARDGKLQLKGEYEAGITIRIDKDNRWNSFFDKLSGWYCIGNTTTKSQDSAVIVAKNMIIVLDKMNKLKAVWIKPEFI